MARGRDREGVIRRSRPRLLKLSNLGLKIFGQDLDLESSTRRHLRWGGGSLRAFRRAISEMSSLVMQAFIPRFVELELKFKISSAFMFRVDVNDVCHIDVDDDVDEDDCRR